jgi:hypothetical protein
MQDQNLKTTVRKQFRIDLNSLLTTLINQKHLIIIGGDFNEHSTSRNILQDMCLQHNLIDIMVLQDNSSETTYHRGKHMLDKFFISRQLINTQTKTKMEDYQLLTNTDHRPLCLQLKFPAGIHHSKAQHARHLNSSHLFQVQQYIKNVHENMTKQNIFTTIETLSNGQITEAIANKIDYKMTQIRLQAEKALKVTAGDWWHKDLVQWKSQLQRCNQVLKQLKKKIPKPNEQIKTVLTEKNKLVTKFRQHTEQGYQIRHKLIQDNISTLYLEDPPNKPKIRRLKQILCNEQIREIYNKIKKKTTDSQNNQVKLQIQADDGQISTIEDPEHISRHIAQYNMTHFAQAKNTPLATYISEDSHFESVTDKSREYTLPQLSLTTPTIKKIVNKFMQNIHEPPKEIGTDIITLEDWVTKLSKWKESITTSPSGLHLGHHKAYLAPGNHIARTKY